MAIQEPISTVLKFEKEMKWMERQLSLRWQYLIPLKKESSEKQMVETFEVWF